MRSPEIRIRRTLFVLLLSASAACALTSCAQREVAANVHPAGTSAVTVGVSKVVTRPLAQHLTISSELAPFEQIDVYAKEAGYVKKLLVDYGTHVKAGQLMALLEIPELEAQLQQDQAEIRAQTDQVKRAADEIGRVKAQHEVAHLQYQRIAGVAKSQPGLVAQQEVDDWQGKDLAAESQLDAARGALAATESQLEASKAKLIHDQALYSYSRITAPFDGVVTQRYANLGALMQAGTNSTQATPLVRLSQENLYRLVIPVPESYIRYIKVGDPVEVRVPALNKSFRGKVTRFSADVTAETRTMHTEVDVPNPNYQLVPGVYAEAVLTLNQKADTPVVPLQALNHSGNQSSVYVVGPDNRVEDRPITLGVQTPNYAEVTSGVHPGDEVIITDRSGIRPGEQVKPQLTAAMAWQGSGQEEQ
jgi:RND family efflux transporter MFP subunit